MVLTTSRAARASPKRPRARRARSRTRQTTNSIVRADARPRARGRSGIDMFAAATCEDATRPTAPRTGRARASFDAPRRPCPTRTPTFSIAPTARGRPPRAATARTRTGASASSTNRSTSIARLGVSVRARRRGTTTEVGGKLEHARACARSVAPKSAEIEILSAVASRVDPAPDERGLSFAYASGECSSTSETFVVEHTWTPGSASRTRIGEEGGARVRGVRRRAQDFRRASGPDARGSLQGGARATRGRDVLVRQASPRGTATRGGACDVCSL